MGIAGAAWATICGQVCSFFILLYMDSRGENIRIRFRNFTPKAAFSRKLFMAEALRSAVRDRRSVATILLNVAAGRYGDAAIAGMSIVTRICMFINSFVVGFGQGFQPVCGYNYGAGIYSRVSQGFWFCVRVGVVFLSVCSVIGYIYAPEVVAWFREGDAEVIAVGARALRWQLVTLPLRGVGDFVQHDASDYPPSGARRHAGLFPSGAVLHTFHSDSSSFLRAGRSGGEPGRGRSLLVSAGFAADHPGAQFV